DPLEYVNGPNALSHVCDRPTCLTDPLGLYIADEGPRDENGNPAWGDDDPDILEKMARDLLASAGKRAATIFTLRAQALAADDRFDRAAIDFSDAALKKDKATLKDALDRMKIAKKEAD